MGCFQERCGINRGLPHWPSCYLQRMILQLFANIKLALPQILGVNQRGLFCSVPSLGWYKGLKVPAQVSLSCLFVLFSSSTASMCSLNSLLPFQSEGRWRGTRHQDDNLHTVPSWHLLPSWFPSSCLLSLPSLRWQVLSCHVVNIFIFIK